MRQAPPIDLDGLRGAVRQLDRAADFDAAQRALQACAGAIQMPILAWSPDVSRPGFDAHMDAFFRRQGWPDDVTALWWDRKMMLKSPIYIRCRTTAMPFATDIQGNLASSPPELRQVAAAMARMGVQTLITAPVHLPRGHVAMVSWGGPQSLAVVIDIVVQARAELLAAGHLFMRAFAAVSDVGAATAEERVRLTPREWECLRFIAQGCREQEVASLVGLAATTVRFHLDNVVRKLGAANRTHAVALAAQLGILGPIS